MSHRSSSTASKRTREDAGEDRDDDRASRRVRITGSGPALVAAQAASRASGRGFVRAQVQGTRITIHTAAIAAAQTAVRESVRRFVEAQAQGTRITLHTADGLAAARAAVLSHNPEFSSDHTDPGILTASPLIQDSIETQPSFLAAHPAASNRPVLETQDIEPPLDVVETQTALPQRPFSPGLDNADAIMPTGVDEQDARMGSTGDESLNGAASMSVNGNGVEASGHAGEAPTDLSDTATSGSSATGGENEVDDIGELNTIDNIYTPPKGRREPRDGIKRMTVKCSLHAAAVGDDIRQSFSDLAETTNTIVSHGYRLIRFIFLRQLEQNEEGLLLESLVKKSDFFREVLLSLASNNWEATALAHPGLLADTRRMRELLLAHRAEYLALVNWDPPTIPRFQQIAIYEGQKMSTAYLNTTSLQFEKQFRRIMEFLLDIRGRTARLREQLQGTAEIEVREAVRDQISLPARRFRRAIKAFTVNGNLIHPSLLDQYTQLLPVLNAYPRLNHFYTNDRFKDVTYGPENHLLAFYRLARLARDLEIKVFEMLPSKEQPWYPLYDS
jgi:hypothetical protein